VKQALRLFALLLRAYLRDRTALFFSLIVPLMLMVIFGYLNLGDFGRVTVSIDDRAKNQSSAQLLQILKGIETLQMTELPADQALVKLRRTELDMLIARIGGEHGTPRLVFSSTAATYGEPASLPITEDSATVPTNPYGATKLAIDHAIGSYASAHGIAAVSLRYFNVAGGYGRFGERHTTETHLIPLVLQVALGRREKIMVFGEDWPTFDGTCIRDYIHVVDLADAHELALAHAAPGEHRIYNLGNGTGFSVQQVVDTCRQVTGHPIPAQMGARRPGDPAVLIAASDRAHCELGWKPQRYDLAVIVADAWEVARNRS